METPKGNGIADGDLEPPQARQDFCGKVFIELWSEARVV